MEVDTALTRLGTCGRWQVLRWTLLGISSYSTLAVHTLVIIFSGQRYTHRCAGTGNSSTDDTFPNKTGEGIVTPGSCVTYDRNDSNATVPCTGGWLYSTPPGGSSIVSEFNLVCSKNYLSDLSQVIFIIGLFVSNLFITALSDRYGRKKVHLTGLLLLSAFSLMLACSPDFLSFVIIRFFVGVFVDGSFSVGFILLCEYFPNSYRGLATSLLLLFWIIGETFVTSMSLLLPNWRHLQAAISAPGVIFVFYFCIIDESIPWLSAVGRPEEAERILRKAAKVNKIDNVDWDIKTGVKFFIGNNLAEPDARETKCMGYACGLASVRKFKRETLVDIMKHRRLCTHLVILCCLWFINNIINSGITLAVGTLSGNLHNNMYILSGFDAISLLAVLSLSHRWGKKRGFCACNVMAGLLLISASFITPKTANGTDLTYLITILILTGKVAVATSYFFVSFYTPEIFPTQTRNLTFGIAMTMGRIGTLLAPFYAYLARQTQWLPSLVFGILSVVIGLIGLYLPETRQRPLFQSIYEMEVWTRGGRIEYSERNDQENSGERLACVNESDGSVTVL